jgi:hypothetical protein
MVTVDTGVQDDILAFVNTALDIRLFELGEDDPRLKLARIYLTLHFATGDASAGIGDGTYSPAGPVTQESAGGLMRQYEQFGAAGDPLLAESYWGRRYLQLIRGKRFGFLVI